MFQEGSEQLQGALEAFRNASTVFQEVPEQFRGFESSFIEFQGCFKAFQLVRHLVCRFAAVYHWNRLELTLDFD